MNLIASQSTLDGSTLEIPQRSHFGGGDPLDTLIERMVRQESGGRPDVRGKKGEIGLLQIMPETAAQYGVTPEALQDPQVNRMVGKRYLTDLLRKYKGNVNLALSAYNAGPGNVDKGNIPRSTMDYVNRILGALGPAEASAAEGPPSGKAGRGRVNIQKMAASPEFRQLPADVQSRYLAQAEKENAGPSIGQRIERSYESVAKPLTSAVAKGIGEIEPKSLQQYVSPEQAAEFVVPQNVRDAAIQAGLLLLGAGAPAKLAESVGMPFIEKFGSTALGRITAMGLAGGLGSKAMGEDFTSGALAGGGSQAGGEALGSALSFAGGLASRTKLYQNVSKEIGGAVGDIFSTGSRALPKLQTGNDIRQFFTYGQGERQFGERLSKLTDVITRRFNPQLPVPMSDGTTRVMSLPEANAYIRKLYALGRTPLGTEKAGVVPMMARDLAHDARQAVIDGINRISPGKGALYSDALRDYGVAAELGAVFRKDVFRANGEVDQAKLERELVKRFPALRRTKGESAIEMMRRIAPGGQTVEEESMHAGARLGDLHIGFPHPPSAPQKFKPFIARKHPLLPTYPIYKTGAALMSEESDNAQ